MEPMPDKQTDDYREYNLICKVKVIEQSYYEVVDDRQHETKSVLLLPSMEATETWRFLTEYLQERATYCHDCAKNNTLTDNLPMDTRKCPVCASENIITERTELPAWIPHPVNSPCRIALLRENNYCPQHHIFVMSTGVEDKLINLDGKKINMTVLKPTDDAVCDNAPSVERSVLK